MWSADTRAAQPRLFSLLRRQCRAERGAGSQAHACIGMPTATDDIHRDLERYQEHWHSGRSWYTYPRGRLLALEQNPRSLRRNSRPSKRLARSLNLSEFVARKIWRRRGVFLLQRNAHRLQRRRHLRGLLVPMAPISDLLQTAIN